MLWGGRSGSYCGVVVRQEHNVKLRLVQLVAVEQKRNVFASHKAPNHGLVCQGQLKPKGRAVWGGVKANSASHTFDQLFTDG
jgi:hypothetical protein